LKARLALIARKCQKLPALPAVPSGGQPAQRVRLFVGILKNLSVDALANALRYEVLHDPMTGIASRRRVLSVMPDWIARHSATLARPFAIVFIDLDGFKAINDCYGHAAGDAILKAVGQRLQDGVGRSDVAARLAGDEFVVLLDGIASQADADRVAARLVEKIAEKVSYGEASIGVQASAGAAVFPADGSTAEELLRRADALMYTHKQRRKATVGQGAESASP
jgi:diguanylate cyclase (GGDEF)-like protein